jgi:hypothetical protein
MKRTLSIAVLLAVVVFLFVTHGPKPPRPNPPNTWSFAVLGDAPYLPWEESQYRETLADLDAHPIDFAVHVGDIFWHPCSDENYRKALGRFEGLRHPLIYTPGDNEWRDCWEPESGAFNPQERLASLRRIFFADPSHSLGHPHLPVVSQGGEFFENQRWVDRGIVFATTHVVSRLSLRHPEHADLAAEQREMEAAAAWVRATFAFAKQTNASAVVIAFQADANFGKPFDDRYRVSFDPWMLALEEESEQFPRPVLLAHGDGHKYTVDHPLLSRRSGSVIENVTRLEVPGSPRVGWVRVVVTPGAKQQFAFDERVVWRFKYW